MNQFLQQIIGIIKDLPLAKKIVMGAVVLVVMGGLMGMLLWANRIDYQPAYTHLAPEDAAEIVERLKEQKIPYQLMANGTGIMVPADKVYEVRLAMAGSGIPKGGDVGFELFDETKFGTTEFVQKLNYQRALQGELARTIQQFREVEDARVMIVMPKDSVFIEESKPPSASVLLKTRSRLSRDKVAAVVHLVSSAVEGLAPNRVTVVDSTGQVLASGIPEEEEPATLANKQLEYKLTYERNLARRIQTMLERIVGSGKAIVRVSADMDFNQVKINEEIYDPEGQVIRSRQNITESSNKNSTPTTLASSVNPITAGGGGTTGRQVSDLSERKDETVNYEINRTVRHTLLPVGRVKRLSVAAVLDGRYVTETTEDGATTRKYVARSSEELEQFAKIVKKAMGFNADREDQVSVESFPFDYMSDMERAQPPGYDWEIFLKQYGRSLVNILLVVLVFLFIVRPIIKGLKQPHEAVEEQPALLETEDRKALPEPAARGELPEPEEMSLKDQAYFQARKDVEKTTGFIRTWINE
ncbi:MAG: flagellar M-ring protein FliF [Deltaproteobacteria bacterium]|nr:flagellar M-ring protein FliF [Deltaproteobacteria bacterium]MBW1995072.1 flagellar M-ring protein FliF [Deltaproteobacteria bacterium]MBW2151755.1 flagellar M-ring protein FliF [Deltaproteobacteria bacterium]